ncbi:MAG: type I restriction-modification system endonuclease [Leptospiraceae bacterium]|nr:type I restriction-modification system endonuclease [Leptospiraceae bacterium]
MNERSNFYFLRVYEPHFFLLAVTSEKNFQEDPNACVVKCRQLAEAIAREILNLNGRFVDAHSNFADNIFALQQNKIIYGDILNLFKILQKEGNEAVHNFSSDHGVAMKCLKSVWRLSIWFHQSVKGDSKFNPGAFQTPESSDISIRKKEEEIQRIQDKLSVLSSQVETETHTRQKIEVDLQALQEELNIWKELAEENENKIIQIVQEYEKKIQSLEQEYAIISEEEKKKFKEKLRFANSNFHLTEDETRFVIDDKLKKAGWIADSQNLTYSKGTRPEEGKNIAIAEWPVTNGIADYVLFIGLVPIATLEAKKFDTDVYSKLNQSERYSLDYEFQRNEIPSASLIEKNLLGWKIEKSDKIYKIPFVFCSNGREFNRQISTKSGIWFRDVRKPTNPKISLMELHTPEGLLNLLKANLDEAHKVLEAESFDYSGLYPFQVEAVRAIEKALSNPSRREVLLEMATGTGKTKTIIGLLYRFLKANRFKRILFLVDRRELGLQAQKAFAEMRLEALKTFSEIYEVKELADLKPDPSTKVHVATVQSMIRRVFGSKDKPNPEPIPIDSYNCIIIDEAHRGYILDRGMGEGELEFRDQDDYISLYRKVLDYFDAVKIGLTATPAQHTTDIFGKPVFSYSYRQAVRDGFLIDHIPPIRLITKLSKYGIHFEKEDKIQVMRQDGSIDLATLPDELDFQVDQFNKRVITENFNRVICEELAKELEPPFDKKKTLIFCVNDNHADLVELLLKNELRHVYGEIHENAVKKITGSIDKPDEWIRFFKMEQYPSIAITVDLLTTGIDVERICNLVFIRRVKSRILYEQMLGRATRLCDDIGKEYFRVFDAVDIYSTLESFSNMKPVVRQVDIPISQLMVEACSSKADEIPGSKEGKTYSEEVKDELTARLNRIIKKAEKKSDHEPVFHLIKRIEKHIERNLSDIPSTIKSKNPKEFAELIGKYPLLPSMIEELRDTIQKVQIPTAYISTHEDELIAKEYGFPEGKKPEDYIESFNQFIKENVNRSIAIKAIVTRPRELTRQALKDLQLELETNGFIEINLRAAYKEVTNVDMAASIWVYP